ncbi:hypothetical protein D3C76_828570 [compost metagenome]
MRIDLLAPAMPQDQYQVRHARALGDVLQQVADDRRKLPGLRVAQASGHAPGLGQPVSADLPVTGPRHQVADLDRLQQPAVPGLLQPAAGVQQPAVAAAKIQVEHLAGPGHQAIPQLQGTLGAQIVAQRAQCSVERRKFIAEIASHAPHMAGMIQFQTQPADRRDKSRIPFLLDRDGRSRSGRTCEPAPHHCNLMRDSAASCAGRRGTCPIPGSARGGTSGRAR